MQARPAIYLDFNAGAPLHPGAVKALLPFFTDPCRLSANPSSVHVHGREARKSISTAKESIARSFGEDVRPESIVLTSSGSEANQHAIRAALEPALLKCQNAAKAHWILSPVEHDSIIQMIPWFEARGGTVSFIPVNDQGLPAAEALVGLLRPETALISVIWVNNETGVITALPSFAAEAARVGVPLHVDAAQAWGKIRLDLPGSGVSFATFAGSKIGGFQGSGVLWVKDGVIMDPLVSVLRGKQQGERRGGTENVLTAIALGAASESLDVGNWGATGAIRDRLEALIQTRIPGVTVNGDGAPRVANTLNLSFAGIERPGLVTALDIAGFSVSSGAACSSGVTESSHVLMAMGRNAGQAKASIRISLSVSTDWKVLESFVDALEKAVARMRRSLRETLCETVGT